MSHAEEFIDDCITAGEADIWHERRQTMTTDEIALRLKSLQGPMELRSLAKDAIAALTERDERIAELERENTALKKQMYEGGAALEMTKRIKRAEADAERLAEAIELWWGGKCPEAWTENRHRDRPYVNTQGSHERGLVDALAAHRQEGV